MSTLEPLPLRIGVSSCLLGAEVRHDGGHKRDAFLVGELAKHVEWVPVCPELEVGMGVPREAVRLLRRADGGLVMAGVASGRDWTAEVESYARERVKALEALQLSGYVLKSRSPSCGMERVLAYPEKGPPRKDGVGLFAAELMRRLPHLPVAEEGRLQDPVLRESFVERVFCRHRWLLFRRERYGVSRLADFHRRHKLLLLAHSEKHLRALGRIVASAKGRATADVLADYERLFFEALKTPSTSRSHVNVLQHAAGFFKEKLDGADRGELHEAIHGYRRGFHPRLVPLTLLRHHLRRLGDPYIEDQVYLSPTPEELALTYHV